jgi:spore coat polysaccharide biosynthesis protein SpsF
MERPRKRITLIQARMGSSRLPGKVLYPLIDGIPSLQLMIERIKRANTGEVIIATSISKADDSLVDFALELDCGFFRGSEDDVFDRCYKAACYQGLGDDDMVITYTADCPLCDPYVSQKVIDTFENLENAEYVTNVNPPTFPDGLDIEVLSFAALKRLHESPLTDLDREHVTLYIRKNTDEFKTANVLCHENLSQVGWALDQPADYEFIKAVYGNLYRDNPCFGMEDILRLIQEKPEIGKINAHLRRNVWFDEVLKAGETHKNLLGS